MDTYNRGRCDQYEKYEYDVQTYPTKKVDKSVVPACTNKLCLGASKKRWSWLFGDKLTIGPFSLTSQKIEESEYTQPYSTQQYNYQSEWSEPTDMHTPPVFGYSNCESGKFVVFPQNGVNDLKRVYGSVSFNQSGGTVYTPANTFYNFNTVLPKQMYNVRLMACSIGTGLQVKLNGIYRFIYDINHQEVTTSGTSASEYAVNVVVYDVATGVISTYPNGNTYALAGGGVICMNTIIPLKAGNVVGVMCLISGVTIQQSYSGAYMSLEKIDDYNVDYMHTY